MSHGEILNRVARLAALFVSGLAAVVLAGWALRAPADLLLAASGASLLLLGISLALNLGAEPATAARACAAAALVLGLVRAAGSIGSLPGLLAGLSAAAAAVALLLQGSGDSGKSGSLSQGVAAVSAAVAGAGLALQWLLPSTRGTAGDVLSTPALNAYVSAGLIGLSGGIFSSRSQGTVQRLLFTQTPAGSRTRRLLTAVLLLPALLPVALLVASGGSASGLPGGVALLSVVYITAGAFAVLASAETTIGIGQQRLSAEETRELFTARLQEQAAQLQETVARRTQELRQANIELHALNERLKLALQSSSYGVFEFDILSGTVLWDERMREIYGLTGDATVRTRAEWTTHIHPWDAKSAGGLFEKVVQGETDLYDTEFRIVRPDGSVRHVEAHGRLQRDPEGRPMRIAGLNQDISAERELEEALKAAEERWQLAVIGANDVVWDWNLETAHVFHDERWAALLGYTIEEVGPTLDSWKRLVHPEDLAPVQAAVYEHIDNNAPFYQAEYRMLRKSGEWAWILDRGRLISRSADGRPLRMVGTMTDITERKRMEQRLRRTDELADQVSRTAQIGGWELDLTTSELTWTPGVRRIYQLDEGFAPTVENSLEFFPPEPREVLRAALEEARTTGKAFDLELPLNTALGGRVWVRVLGRTESRRGVPVRIFGALQDITAKHETETARRKLEAQLFHAQKLETLGTLSGGIAHDFNNLLTGIIGYHELAAESMPEDHPARACLTEARKASLRARELVDQILTFGRQSSGMGLESTDLSQVVEEVRRFLRATLPANITIHTQIADGFPDVMADTTQIHQVLINLGSNAAHAMRAHGGSLTIGLSKGEVDPDRGAALGGLAPGTYLHLTVADTGHGMDEATMQRIFDPFFTTKSTREGSGLGLAVVHGIIRAHRGAIHVESTVGVGSKFHIYLPAVAEKKAAAEVGFAQAPNGRGERVCIVDDEEIVVRSTKVALEKKGYRVSIFSSAETFLDYLRANPSACDVLITDQTMPGMQGTELASAARAVCTGLPVVIMSGYFAKIPSRALDELGPVKLLSKPFTGNELAFSVYRALHPGA